MADQKISVLPSATAPVAGTEVLPIVQGDVTKKVSIANLTSGRAVSVAGLTDTTLDASKPVFTDANKKLTNTGTLATNQGGTGLTTYSQGDLVYYNTGTTLTALAKNTSATRYLANTGTSNNPAWAQVDLTNGVTGGLPQANIGDNVAGTGPAVIARTNSNQDFTTNTFTKLSLSSEEYDTNSNFSSGTFTPTVAGFYIVNTFTAFSYVSGADATRVIVALYKNGSIFNRIFDLTGTVSPYLSGSTVFYANGSTDYFEIYVYSNAANPRINAGTGGNQVAYSLLRKAV